MRGAIRPNRASRARGLHPRSDAGGTGDRAANTKTPASGSKTPRRHATRDVASSAGSARMLTRSGQPVRRSDPSSRRLNRNRTSGQRLAGRSTRRVSRSPDPDHARRAHPITGRGPDRRGHSTRGSSRSPGLNPKQRRKPGHRSVRSHGGRSSPDPNRESDPRPILPSERGRDGTGNPNEHHDRPPTAGRPAQSSTRRSRRSLAERAVQRDAGFEPSIRVVVGRQRAVAPETARGREADASDSARGPLHATAEPSSR
jgi:hypothetical protein